MVKLTGPGLGKGASGSLGGALIFSSSKGRAYVKQHRKPKQPRSAGQVAIRAMMKFLSSQWSEISAADQTTWLDGAQRQNISPINAYQAENLRRFRNNLRPSHTWPPPLGGANVGVDGVTATGLIRAIRIQFTTHNAIDTWGEEIHDSMITSPAGVWNTLCHVEPIPVAKTYDFILTGKQPGTHYIAFKWFLTTGRLGDPIWWQTACVLD